jgi:NAD(P)-dependent dehydrogenase (short-subunit alcohol dehydrogenase family)
MLDGRVCLVAGGGNGLGEAAAHELADHGASVVVNDLGTSVRGESSDPAVAEAVAADIRANGGTAIGHHGDLTEFDYAASLIDATVEEFGRLDFVANFAGILRDEMSYRLDEADWNAVVETNLTGQFALLQAACRHWREAAESDSEGDDSDGLDVERSYLAASSYAAKGNLGQANYAASKAGILGLVRSVSTEMARNDVRVNALVPNGYTRMTETVPEEHRPYTREEMPPEKVAPLVAYLASDDAEGITGCTLYAGGDRVGVFSDPSLDTVGVRPGGWSLEELQTYFRDDVADELNLNRTDAFF